MIETEPGISTELKLQDISLAFGNLGALTNVTVEVKHGEILAIIGPNGAGKTSLLNVISGFYRPQRGQVYFEGRRITHFPPDKVARLGIARTFQNIELFTGLSTLDNLIAGRHILLKSGVLAQAAYFGKAYREAVKHREAVEQIIEFLEMEPIRDKPVSMLPYGLRKRVELGRALAMEPKLLLLDEPMAGMNVEEKEDMARFILDVYEEKEMTIILIEHDMGMVMDISDRVVVLDIGHKIAEGTPKEIIANPVVVQAYLGGGAALPSKMAGEQPSSAE